MKYPVARIQPVAVTFGRVSYTDSYQWLEEPTPEALEWQALQNRCTQDWFASNPARARAEALMASMPGIEADFPLFSGGRWFRKRTPQGAAMQLIEVAEAAAGPWRCVLDLKTIANGRILTIDLFAPSPDGLKLYLGLGVDGMEIAELRVLEVDSGKMLLESIPQVYAIFPAWLPDSSGFYISARDPANIAAGARIYRHVLGAPAMTQPEDYEVSADQMWAKPAGDGRHTLLIADHLNPRIEYIRDEIAGSGWSPFFKGETAQLRGEILGEHCYAVTDDGARCGRVVSIPLATPRDRGTWKELVPGSHDVLATLLIIDGLLVLADLVDTWSRLRVFDRHGQLQGEIPLPGKGAVSHMQFAIWTMIDMIRKGADGDVIFPFSSPARSVALYQAKVRTREVTQLTEPAVKIDAQILDHFATSADGARVPYHVIARADVDLSKSQPTAMYGYGGFQAALIPGWSDTWLAAWIKAGGVLVLMHLRGGGELGQQMWEQGRLEHKQNSFNDVYAIGEDLIARGISSAAQLGVVGGSNGGVMASVVVVQRPDLFRASIAQSPSNDILARGRDPIAVSASLDYGDPNDPAMSEVINRWSPYQNIKDGTVYPALLLDAGAQDVRCPPWHVRKMAARMQPANAGPNPVLMLVREGVGHGANDVKCRDAQGLDWLTFFLDQLGVAR
jgi:prolyl oligopeptidase